MYFINFKPNLNVLRIKRSSKLLKGNNGVIVKLSTPFLLYKEHSHLGVAIHVRVLCRVHVVSSHEYWTIWVNPNLTCLLNVLRFFNSNTTHLLNGLVVSTRLSDFICMAPRSQAHTGPEPSLMPSLGTGPYRP